MTTWKRVEEPDAPIVWTEEGTRVVHEESDIWLMPNGDTYSWAELLDDFGPLYSTHPYLRVGDPLPWSFDGDEIYDANGERVNPYHVVGAFIVKAVNAYGELLASEAGEVSAGGLIARKFLAERDAARVEVDRLRRKLSALGGA